MITLDEFGRILIPLELRRQLGWEERDSIYMTIKDNSIVMRKVTGSCIFCGALVDIVKMGRHCVCRGCINRLNDAKNGDVLYVTKA